MEALVHTYALAWPMLNRPYLAPVCQKLESDMYSGTLGQSKKKKQQKNKNNAHYHTSVHKKMNIIFCTNPNENDNHFLHIDWF